MVIYKEGTFLLYHMKSKKKSPGLVDPEDQLKRLGARIKQLRIKKGYSNYEHFAYDHDISRAQFGRYEQGQDLRFSTLVRLVKAFDMTMKEFFGEGF